MENIIDYSEIVKGADDKREMRYVLMLNTVFELMDEILPTGEEFDPENVFQLRPYMNEMCEKLEKPAIAELSMLLASHTIICNALEAYRARKDEG